MTPSALTGIRVIDLTELLPGPLCTLILGDFGAEVIKVERPPAGDPSRDRTPLVNGFSTRFAYVSRNKQSVLLNLKEPHGKAAFLNLVKTADVLVEGYRPGVTARLGIDYASLAAINSQLVYCSMTGFGHDSPHRMMAGHDLNYLAMAGTLDMVGPPEAPSLPGLPIADVAGGTYPAVMGILLALMARERTGTGQFVDTAFMDGAFYMQVEGLSHLFGGVEPVRGQTTMTGRYPYFGIFRTSDGRFMTLAALEEKFWANFCTTVGRPDLLAGHLAEGTEKERVVAHLQDLFASRTQADWTQLFAGVDACCTPVRTVREAVEDPHVVQRGLVITHEHPVAGTVRMPGFLPRLSGTPGQIRSPAPLLGADTASVLQGLGLAPAEIARVQAETDG